MKQQADKNRNEQQFSVGDQVYLKVHPYLQNSLAARRNQKLVLSSMDPIKCFKKWGSILQAPSTGQFKIHDVIHVSQLKKHLAPSTIADQEVGAIVPREPSLLQPATFL